MAKHELMDKAYPLSSPNAADTALFGAKAVQLGFSVPDGFAIPRTCTESEFAVIAQGIIDELSLPVAVRSSATKEDSATKAFAGQFETCLGIRSIADLISSFTAVKNSGATDHVKKYHGEAIPPEQIAVLVQRMVNATRAGVAFSRDPVTRGTQSHH